MDNLKTHAHADADAKGIMNTRFALVPVHAGILLIASWYPTEKAINAELRCFLFSWSEQITTLGPIYMADISQTKFPSAFSWMKMYEFR